MCDLDESQKLLQPVTTCPLARVGYSDITFHFLSLVCMYLYARARKPLWLQTVPYYETSETP